MSDPLHSYIGLDGLRRYRVGDRRLLSVTSVLSLAPAPELAAWKTSRALRAAFDRRHDLAAIQDDETADRDRLLAWCAEQPNTIAAEAADRGTRAHEAAAVSWVTTTETDDREVRPFQRRFREQVELWGVEQVAVEASVANLTYGYAGSADLVARVPALAAAITGDPEALGLIDIKTGAVRPSAALQIAAYANAEHVIGTHGQLRPMPPVKWGAVLHLRPRKSSWYPVQIGKGSFTAFLRVLQMAHTQVSDESRIGPRLFVPDEVNEAVSEWLQPVNDDPFDLTEEEK